MTGSNTWGKLAAALISNFLSINFHPQTLGKTIRSADTIVNFIIHSTYNSEHYFVFVVVDLYLFDIHLCGIMRNNRLTKGERVVFRDIIDYR